ncbi:MAG: hypothetical protein M1822_007531 [Bathelium mastoideum]|nr:MAG: hypothetical protein M1822_007531 [Bathelium mastoideum]
MVLEYYEQRASVPGTLITSEATFISNEAAGYDRPPGIWSDEQVAAWKKITDAVHAKRSFINCQLWALGRTADPAFLHQKGYDVTAPSAIAIPAGGTISGAPNPHTPRALSESEIESWIAAYAHAARQAIRAGFDGVEIHGANGYLVDQFLQEPANHRTDRWGGSIENRSRFALAVSSAVVDAIGADRTGIRLSPFTWVQGMGLEEPEPQFAHLIKGLRELDLAFIHVIMGSHRPGANRTPAGAAGREMVEFVFREWGNDRPVILAGRYEPETARKAVEEEFADKAVAIGFGRHFISNPDLPFRLEHGLGLTPYDTATFYAKGDPIGYADYPFSQAFLKARM